MKIMHKKKIIVSEFQRLLLENLAEDKCWDHGSTNGQEKRSLAVMEEKGLVRSVEYSNGLHWEMTDKGYEELSI